MRETLAATFSAYFERVIADVRQRGLRSSSSFCSRKRETSQASRRRAGARPGRIGEDGVRLLPVAQVARDTASSSSRARGCRSCPTAARVRFRRRCRRATERRGRGATANIAAGAAPAGSGRRPTRRGDADEHQREYPAVGDARQREACKRDGPEREPAASLVLAQTVPFRRARGRGRARERLAVEVRQDAVEGEVERERPGAEQSDAGVRSDRRSERRRRRAAPGRGRAVRTRRTSLQRQAGGDRSDERRAGALARTRGRDRRVGVEQRVGPARRVVAVREVPGELEIARLVVLALREDECREDEQPEERQRRSQDGRGSRSSESAEERPTSA